MDKKQLQKELTQCKVFLSHASESKNFYDRMVAEAETRLAEAEKPELRHGDYCRCKHGELYIALNSTKRDDEFQYWGIDGKYNGCTKKTLSYYTATGKSIFADLTALSKDMTEFELGEGTRSNICELDGRRVIIRPSVAGSVIIDSEDLATFIRNLQIMEATMKRQKNG